MRFFPGTTSKTGGRGGGGATYDFEELALETIFPSLALQLFGDLENLLHSAGYHTHRLVCLRDKFCGRCFDTVREGHSPTLLPS